MEQKISKRIEVAKAEVGDEDMKGDRKTRMDAKYMTRIVNVTFSAGGTSENPVLSTKAEGETLAAQKSQ